MFDLDGTLTRGDTFKVFAGGLLARNPSRWIRVPLLLIPVLGFALRLIDNGGLKGAVMRVLFSGLRRSEIHAWAQQVARSVVEQRLFPEALAAFRAHLSAGDYTVIMSASPDLYVPLIARALGASECICTPVRWNGERLDGRLAGPNCRGGEKARILERLRQQHPGLPVIGYGNSGADVAHLTRCDEAVYVNARPRIRGRLEQLGFRCVQWH
ncbi:MAG: HAD-IB family hydrolase [Pseudomonadota bacterium]